jgi:hypothetical protein
MICFGRFSSSKTSSIWQPEHMCAHAIFCLRSKVATLPSHAWPQDGTREGNRSPHPQRPAWCSLQSSNRKVGLLGLFHHPLTATEIQLAISVSATLRVVLSTRRTPSRFSSRRIARLTLDLGTPSRFAALVKL